jgi:hypothetical protein
MTRQDKQLNLWFRYWTAGACLRDALIACDREAKAKNSAVRRKARNEATENLLEFRSCISPMADSLSKELRKIADALDGKRYRYVRPNDKIEEAVAAVLGVDSRNELRFVMKAMKTPFSLRRFKQELARIYGITPKELTKKTPSERDRAKNKTEEEELEKPSGTKPKFFDSHLRRTLKCRGYSVSGKRGRPKKSPRLTAE